LLMLALLMLAPLTPACATQTALSDR
jgi:hypothetical protein